MYWFFLLLAENDAPAAPAAPAAGQGNPLLQFAPIIVFAVIMFVMMGRSSSKQRREQQNLLTRLKKNDKVITSAGIIGVVAAIKENEDEVTLRVDDSSNTRIRVLKSTIVRVTSDDQTAAAPVGDTKTS